MSSNENILADLQSIFRVEFSDQTIILNESTTADEIKMWDSITHMGLMFSIEQHYNISFSLDEIISFQSIGDLVNTIKVKI
ncbi:MAG: acyl carrier protein [Mucilaginibacter sp.]|jgi:acyl carrier protein|nr:acyl carrier protein [Mucilaginibacter sp.]